MLGYISRRFLLMTPTLFGMTLVVFFIVQTAPGGPVEQAIQQLTEESEGGGGFSSDLVVTEQLIEDLKRQYGFDKPIHQRYLSWLGDLLQGDFGVSHVYDEPAIDVISSKFPVSLQFGLTSLFLTYLICIPLGVAKALRDKSVFDYVTSFFVLLGYSTPGFVLGIILVVFFGGGSFFDWFPIGGLHADNYEELGIIGQISDRIMHAILPLLCYVIANFAELTMLTKNSLLGELHRDYMKTARSKGVSTFSLTYRHALRNALIPIVTGIGGIFTVIFAGSLLIETVFNLDGIGLLTYNAVLKRDYTVIMASVTIHSLLIMFGNLFSDVVLVMVDPRIDFSR